MFGSRHDDTTPTTGPSRGFIAAAALIALVAVGLVVVLVVAFTSRDDTPPTAASPAPTSTATATATTTSPVAPGGSGEQGRPAGCATTGTDQAVPTTPIAGTTWSLVDGFAVPSTSADGPTIRGAASIGYCYSRTPAGAVLAASNFGHGAGDAQAVVNAVLANTAIDNEFARQIAATPATEAGGGGGGIQLAGFRVLSYSPDAATIALALRSNGATNSFSTVTLVEQWSDGDWRVVPQAGPTFFLNPATTSSISSFVPWSGVA